MGSLGRRGQIIFLNGTSSPGKSSIAGQLLLMLDPPVFHLSVDAINDCAARIRDFLRTGQEPTAFDRLRSRLL